MILTNNNMPERLGLRLISIDTRWNADFGHRAVNCIGHGKRLGSSLARPFLSCFLVLALSYLGILLIITKLRQLAARKTTGDTIINHYPPC
jgi:hypothetical protein